MSDRTLTCRDCGQEFVFTAGEQEFYQQRGFSEPQRCRSCRDARKSQRNSGGDSYASGGYGGGGGYGNRSEGGSASYGGRSGGSYSDQPRQLFPAVCSECGAETQVPFNPTPGKPVYCRNCFTSRRSSERYNSW